MLALMSLQSYDPLLAPWNTLATQSQGKFMIIRNLKIVLVVLVSLQALLIAVQNVVNLDAAYQSVAYVVSNQDHTVYASSIGPAITNPILIWIALAIILIGEFSAGFLAAKGAFDLWSNRNGSATEFRAAKKFGLLGCGMSMVVFFGLFMVIAGYYFQMWQTQIGAASFNGAFQYFTASALVMLFLNMADD